NIHKKKELTYIEPFIGSGAIMFWFLQKFQNVRKAVINDINGDLTKAYTIIKDDEDRKSFFLEKREEFNSRHLSYLDNTALFIFLNRTCFNGLYRVNSKNH